ncbi:efflux RND transporter periplasmic adaptor subunit [Paenibacillus sp. y28]|uniref:efflux RND transporter periplasmic adaptor subunit n=1 Tax=Paenibacillus sp. y28 TaxID=3129110 RepID=UPI003015CE23
MKKGSTELRNRKYRPLHMLAVVTVAAVVAAGCSGPGGANGPAEAQLSVRAVKTEPVTKKSIGAPIEQVAEFTSMNTLDVIPRVSGEVVEVLKSKGDYVEKGDVLFRIDSRDAESSRAKNELSLQSAQQNLKKAKEDQVNNRKDLVHSVETAATALSNAEQDYNKLRNEFDAGSVTEHEVDQGKQKVEAAKRSLESAQNKLAANDSTNAIVTYETQAESAKVSLEDSQRSLENYSVRAPVSGILTDFTAVGGKTVSASAKVGQVQQVDPLKIKTELTESNYQLVKNKQELVYYNPDTPDNKQMAKLSYLAPIISAETKTYTLELEVANTDHQLKPGTRVMVQLNTEAEQQVVVVPTLSIVREDNNTYVFVLEGDHYTKRKVKLGRINGSYQEILDGVKEGEQLVTTGQNQLKDGQKVEAATQSPSSASETKKN